MFLDVWDVRLEISAVSTHVNLNGLSVHLKNRTDYHLSFNTHYFCLFMPRFFFGLVYKWITNLINSLYHTKKCDFLK